MPSKAPWSLETNLQIYLKVNSKTVRHNKAEFKPVHSAVTSRITKRAG
ncbi:hypothetical protein CAMRE0001_1198 [Campylobacter rectus RM3267]|uniref:Uncharacterized protein n=1 Tax=Campylobacter rectus RM3267 TaxID=553218 RepID=B9D0J4_CAMRE|nr:hypothetical protein CAMRE0001_1198 [Campylobacter rectus RM3267]